MRNKLVTTSGRWRRSVQAALLSLVIPVALVSLPDPAAAAVGTTTLCSYGDYDSWLALPRRGSTTPLVPAGQCWSTHLGVYSSEQADVFGRNGLGVVYLGSRTFNDFQNSAFVTRGSLAGFAYYDFYINPTNGGDPSGG